VKANVQGDEEIDHNDPYIRAAQTHKEPNLGESIAIANAFVKL